MKTIKIKLLNKIPIKGYPRTSKCYKQAHQRANIAEIKKYGKQHFNKLNKLIKTILPINELAGKHTKQGIIQLSNKIPKRYRNQIKFHELIEMNNMKSKNC